MKRNFFVLADEGVKASDDDLKLWQEAFFESLDDNAKSLYDSWTSFPENFSQKSGNSDRFHQKVRNVRNFAYFLEYAAKFRENFIRIGAKFDEEC